MQWSSNLLDFTFVKAMFIAFSTSENSLIDDLAKFIIIFLNGDVLLQNDL